MHQKVKDVVASLSKTERVELLEYMKSLPEPEEPFDDKELWQIQVNRKLLPHEIARNFHDGEALKDILKNRSPHDTMNDTMIIKESKDWSTSSEPSLADELEGMKIYSF